VDVGRDRVGRRALRDRRFGDRVVEAAAAVADVEEHAALLRFERRRQQLAVLDDVGELARDVRRARVAVGRARRPGAACRGSATSARTSRRRRCGTSPFAPVPESSHAPDRALSGSRPCFAITFSDMRTLMPMTMSAFSARLRRRSRGREVDVEELRNRKPARPMFAMWTKRIQPRARLRRRCERRNTAKLLARHRRGHRRRTSLIGDEFVCGNSDWRTKGKTCENAVSISPATPSARHIENPLCTRRGMWPRLPRSRRKRIPISRFALSLWLGSSTVPPSRPDRTCRWVPFAAQRGESPWRAWRRWRSIRTEAPASVVCMLCPSP
jgi:hypothetical protein